MFRWKVEKVKKFIRLLTQPTSVWGDVCVTNNKFCHTAFASSPPPPPHYEIIYIANQSFLLCEKSQSRLITPFFFFSAIFFLIRLQKILNFGKNNAKNI